MKTLAIATVFALLLVNAFAKCMYNVLSSILINSVVNFQAELTPSAVVPTPSSSTSIGLAELDFFPSSDTLSVYLLHDVPDAFVIQILGPSTETQTGPIVFTFPSTASPASAIFTNISTDVQDQLKNNMLYIQIFSNSFPSGAIRGQIMSFTCPLLPCMY